MVINMMKAIGVIGIVALVIWWIKNAKAKKF
jgi:hypothetical protein